MRLNTDPGLGQLEQAVRSRSVSTWQGLDFQLTLSPSEPPEVCTCLSLSGT